jgi:ornithine decarboxylase
MADSLKDIYDTHPEISLDFSRVREAVQQGYKTPFLLMDPELIRIKARRFKAAMPRVHPHYAVKANPHPVVIRTLIQEGVGFEIASISELDLLRKFSVPAKDVYYSNPIKSSEYLEYAARMGVEWYVLDCVDELRKIVRIKPDAKLYLRIDTQQMGSDWPLSGKFGASLPESKEIIAEAVKLKADLAGVTFHVGSQCRNVDNWHIGIDNAKMVFDLMGDAGLKPRLLNIGGGYPVRHVKPIPSIEKIGERVNEAIADLPDGIRVMAEPGRYLVSDSAYYVCRVVGTATRAGVRWIYLDAGVFGGLIEAHEGLQYEVYTDAESPNEIPCTVAGPTCDSLDVICKDEMLPEDLEEGDYVYIPNAGAYTTAYASNFNGFPLPEVVVL